MFIVYNVMSKCCLSNSIFFDSLWLMLILERK